MVKGDFVIDKHGKTGVVSNVSDTGSIQVLQKPNVTCTYDDKRQLMKLVHPITDELRELERIVFGRT